MVFFCFLFVFRKMNLKFTRGFMQRERLMSGNPRNPSKAMNIIWRMYWRHPEYEKVLIMAAEELTWHTKIGNW